MVNRYEINGVTSHLCRGGKVVVFAHGEGGVYDSPKDLPKVTVPWANVCGEGSITLKHEVRVWLAENVGRQQSGVPIPVWDFIAADSGEKTATLQFVSLESATLFKMFWS